MYMYNSCMVHITYMMYMPIYHNGFSAGWYY